MIGLTSLDVFPLLAALLSAIPCALLGNFLLLRRQSMMGDAISHSVLPGLVLAFMLTSSRASLPMFLGAGAAALVAVGVISLIRSLGRVDPSASMGVVFSVLFALGVLLLSGVSGVDGVDIDADCVLNGQLELLMTHTPPTPAELIRGTGFSTVPRQVWTLGGLALAAIVSVVVLSKELKITSFDPALAASLGFSPARMNAVLMLLVAGAAVASFEAVGAILVIALLICPSATARLCTDRYHAQMLLSVVIGAANVLAGYLAAIHLPSLFGLEAVSIAGSIATMNGVSVVLAALCAPSHGVIARLRAHVRRVREIALDDCLAAIFRQSEPYVPTNTRTKAASPPTLRRASRLGLVTMEGPQPRLTELGVRRARRLVRAHRLWEAYLVDEAGLSPDHVHDTAELLEHTGVAPSGGPDKDPHGKAIPGEAANGAG